MQHDFLKSVPFDLFELHLLHLVAHSGSFTRAGASAGFSQSAITRQIQGIEERLGVPLFERTTRRMALTLAGEFLLRETAHILGDVNASIRRIREEFADAPKLVRAGISRSIGLAYLPGFFFANRRHHPEVEITVTHEAGKTIIEKIESDALDVGVLCPPDRLPSNLDVVHRFKDDFVLITPENSMPPTRQEKSAWKSWTEEQNWLLLDSKSQTGSLLREWIGRQRWKIRPSMEMDNFDSLIQLVALGMGASFVPHRALALHTRKRGLRRHLTPTRFSRELVVVTRRSISPPPHVTEFVRQVLF
jgi:DNA-binding transcriptional LysR family regulator